MPAHSELAIRAIPATKDSPAAQCTALADLLQFAMVVVRVFTSNRPSRPL